MIEGLNLVGAGAGKNQPARVEYERVNDVMAFARSLGMSRVRITAAWSLIERSAGSYQFGDLDIAVAAAADHGLSPLLCIEKKPWLRGSATSYGNVVEAVVARYGADWGVVDAWEVWNEPNSPRFFPGANIKEYLSYFRAAVAAILSVQPTATILTAGLVGAAADDPFWKIKSPVTFLDSLFRLGIGDIFNEIEGAGGAVGIGWHPYFTEADYKLTPVTSDANAILKLQGGHDLLVKHGWDHLPFWLTEWGHDSVRNGLAGQAERTAAQNAVLQPYRDLGWIGPEFYFNAWDWRVVTGAKDDKNYFFGAATNAGVWKPTAYVLAGVDGAMATVSGSAAIIEPIIGEPVDPNAITLRTVSGSAAIIEPIIEESVAPFVFSSATIIEPEVVELAAARRVSVGTPTRVVPATPSGTISGSPTHDVEAVSDRVLVLGLVLSHGQQRDWYNYNTFTVVSDLDGALTRRASRYLGPSHVKQGTAHLFELWNPTPGTHTIAITLADSVANFSELAACTALFRGVSAINNVNSKTSGGGSLNFNVSSAPNHLAVMCGGFAGNPGGFTGDTIYQDGEPVSGVGDYIIFGDKTGAATVNFNTSTIHTFGVVGLNLVKA